MPEFSASPILIENVDDWNRLIDRKLTTVLDPMVFRAGEIFLRGRSGRALGDAPAVPLEASRAWDFLDKNLLALGFFFDALILNERLPLFNYGDTFDMHLNFEQRSFAAFNDADRPALEPVDVTWSAYIPIKERALATLRARLGNREEDDGPWLLKDEAQAIIDELSHVEFQWDIALGPELEMLLPTDLDRRLGRFLLGGMIFGEYADHMQSEHWLQPKRASLFVKAIAGGRAPDRQDEQKLFDWLAKKYELPALNCWQPTFLHHVLEQAKSLSDVPSIVNKLRQSGPVMDYRAWRTQALHEWRTKGGLGKNSLRTIERLRHALTTRGGGYAAASDAGVAWVETAVKQSPDSAAKAVAKTAPLFGWVLDALPGRRHVKLLANSAHARGRYPHIERSVRSLWEGQL
ncbi:MAG: hypothetical protein WA373_01680 [Burkholderiales bacterium]